MASRRPPRLPPPTSWRHGAPRASRRPRHRVTAPPAPPVAHVIASRRPPRLPSPTSWRHGAPAPLAAHVIASRRPPRLPSPTSWRHGALLPPYSLHPPPRTRKRPRIAAGPQSDDTPVAYSTSVPSSGTDSSDVCSTPEVALTVNFRIPSPVIPESASSSVSSTLPLS